MARIGGREEAAAVVAELGRPETPEETAERKALSSRTRRANQNTINLILAISASLLIVAFLIVVVVRPNAALTEPVDYHQVAAEAQATVSEPLADPELTKDWTANNAELKAESDGVQTWYVGLISPDRQFIAISQGISANETWVSNQLGGATATGNSSIGGLDWAIYDRRTAKEPGNLAYAMVATVGSSSIVVFGTADTDEFTILARAVAADLTAKAETR